MNELKNKIEAIEENENTIVVKKRGRPRKEETQQKEEIKKEEIKIEAENFSKDLEPVAGVILSLIEPRLPNPIPFTDFEKNLFSKQFAKLGEKYFKYVGSYSIELSFSITALSLLMPRLKKEVKPETKKETIKNDNI